MWTISVKALALLALFERVDASGSALRVHEDFHVFSNRRGGGGGALGPLTTGTTTGFLADGTGTARGTTNTNFQETSLGWRAVTESIGIIVNGVGNWFIGAHPTIPLTVPLAKDPVLVQIRRSTSVLPLASYIPGPNDHGPFAIRPPGTALTAPTATGMCTGAYSGTYFIGEKYGIVQDFNQLSARVSGWNPGTHSGGVGLTWSFNQVVDGVNNVYRTSQYVAVIRARDGGPELCAGIFKIVNGAAVAMAGQTQSVTIPTQAAFNQATYPANGTLAPNQRVMLRFGVRKSGNTMSLWLNDPSSAPIVTVTDSSPLPAGSVGLASFAMFNTVWDDFTLLDAPTCTDGIWNGEEEGRDCGGASQSGTCGACGATETFTHNFGTEGLTGLHSETYCTSGGHRVPWFETTGIRWRTNCNLNWPGSTGTNMQEWGGAWFLLANKWPTAKNIDLTVTQNPGDNDRQGMVWRYLDSNNYYSVEMRSESVAAGFPLVVHRRKNGVNTRIFEQVGMVPAPHLETIVQVFRVTMTGNAIQVFSNRDGGSLPNVLIADVVDPEPLDEPGYVGINGAYQDPAVNGGITYRINRPAVTLPTLPPGLVLTTAAQTNLAIFVDPTALAPSSGLALLNGLSPTGFSFSTAPLILGVASAPGMDAALSSTGTAASFNGVQALFSSSRIVGDPGITGMTILLAFVPRTGEAQGQAGVILGKGLRERPYNADASGWRLQLVNLLDRPITGATGSQAVQFYAQTGMQQSADQVADVAVPIQADGRTVVVGIRVRPSTVTTGDLHTRTFVVDATLNNVAFTDVTNNGYTGIISSSRDAMLSMGATDVLTDGFDGGVLETMVWRGAVNDTDWVAAHSYMMARYVTAAPNCPDIATSQPDAVVVSGTCTGAVNGAVCQLGCRAGTTAIAGVTGVLTCRNGRWLGEFPRCSETCPALTAIGTGSNGCFSTISTEAFPLLGRVGQIPSLPEYRHWRVFPVVANNWLVSSAGVISAEPAPLHRFAVPLWALLNAPAWGSSTAPTVVTQRIIVPPIIPLAQQPAILSAVPRFSDINNYYAIDLVYTPGVPGQTVRLRRVRNGDEAVLCSLAVSSPAGSVLTFVSEMNLNSGGDGSLRVNRNGASWCSQAESAFNYISSGTAGYGVRAMPGFSSYSFGPQTVERFTTPCPLGCSDVVVNGTCTLPCNTGTIGRGDNTRTCLPGGNYSGTTLVCDNGAPVLSDVAVSHPENQPPFTAVGAPFPSRMASGRDGTGTILFEIVSGNLGNAFSIDSCTGQVRVANPAAIDFERLNATGSWNSFALRVRASVTGSEPPAQTFATMTVTITNAPDAPIITTSACQVAENSQRDTSNFCTLQAIDPDGTGAARYSFAFEEVPGLFRLDSVTGVISVGDVATLGGLNFERKASYRLLVRAADPAIPSLFSERTVFINVLDEPEAPVVTPGCQLIIDETVMANAGQQVPNFNAITNCVRDEDFGSVITGVTATVLSNALVFISGTGQAAVLQAKTYPGAVPVLRDGLLVVDFGVISLQATDNSVPPRVGSGTIQVYVRSNATTSGPIIRGVSVTSVTGGSGSGSLGSEHLLNTNGQDSVLFSGDNMIFTPTDVLVANVTQIATTRFFTVTCSYQFTGMMSGSLQMADGIRCPTRPGWGRNWQWTITRTVGVAAPVVVPSSIALVTHYAPPIVTYIGPPGGTPGAPMNYPTAGGTPIQISGHNFGAAGTPITVDFGMETAPGVFQWFTDQIASFVPSHTAAVGTTRAGAGTNLLVRVTVGGQVALAVDGVRMTYNRPTITAISRPPGSTGLASGVAAPVGGVVISGVRTLTSGVVVVINGTNLGPPILTGMRLLFGISGVHADDNLPYVATNCFYPIAAVSHVMMHCIAPAAPSGTYTAVVEIANQRSVRTTNATVGTTVQYYTAHVQTVTGPGARLTDTRGGQLVFFTGTNFGPRSAVERGICGHPRVLYGWTNGSATAGLPLLLQYRTLRYEATDCQILDDIGTQMSCRMVAGTGWPSGTQNWFRWTVIGCTDHGWTGLLGTIRYAPPIVTNFEDGGVNTDTRGGSAVTIFGSNFGPTMEWVQVRYFAPVTGPDGVVREVRFNAVGCTKPDPELQHEIIRCNTVPGAGQSLRWEVEVETQLSVSPSSAYRQPVVNFLSTSPASDLPVLAANGNGGTVVFIRGSQFGPSNVPSVNRNLIQSVTIGPAGADSSVQVTIPSSGVAYVTDHTMLRVTLPPGIGRNLVLTLKIADVEVTTIGGVPGQFISYADPQVVSILPVESPNTRGGEFARVFVRNAGLMDPGADVELSINGQSVPVTDRFPTLEAVQRGALTAAERDENLHYLEFLVPEGVGAGLPVGLRVFKVGNATITARNNPRTDGPASWFRYAAPTMNLVSVDNLPSSLVAQYTAEFPQDVSEFGGWRVLTVLGRNFGPDRVYGMLQLKAVDTSGMDVDADWRAGSDAVHEILEWSHERVVAVVKLTAARVQVSVMTINPMAANPVYGSDAPLSSTCVPRAEACVYLNIAPVVTGIVGATTNFNTAANPPQAITINTRYTAFFNTIDVRVGNSSAQFLEDDLQTVIPASSVYTRVVQPQVSAQAGTPLQEMTIRLFIRIPPGEGAQVPIIVVRDNVPGAGSITISYAAPTVQRVMIMDQPATNRVPTTMTTANPFLLPTSGALVAFYGINFGLCPIVRFAGTTANACAGAGVPGTLRILEFNHTTVVAEIPQGVGRGLPTGFAWGLRAGAVNGLPQDSVPANVFYAYAPPVITAIMPEVNTTGLPTLGGVSIMLMGSSFGPFTASLPVVTFMTRGADGIMGARCANVVRDSAQPHSLLRCDLPDGSGARLTVNVQVGDQTGTSAGIFSYDAPTVTAVRNMEHNNRASGPAFGNYTVAIDGANFGPSSFPGHCVFLPSSAIADSALICNGRADNWDETEFPNTTIVSWSHSRIVVNMVAGIGQRVIRVATPGIISAVVSGSNSSTFTYDAPVITRVQPVTSDTTANRATGRTELITVVGTNFGFGSIGSVNLDRLNNPNYRRLDPQMPRPGSEGPDLRDRNWPSPYAVRVEFFSATRCITSSVSSDALDATGPVRINQRPAQVASCKNDESPYSRVAGVVTHANEEMAFYALPGVGTNRTLFISVVGPDGTVVRSNGWSYSYTPPAVTSVTGLGFMRAPTLSVSNPNPLISLWNAPSRTINVLGTNFGPTDAASRAEMSDEERFVAINIGGTPCQSIVASGDGFECQYEASDVPLSNPRMPIVGFRRVTGNIAGQSIMPQARTDLVHVVCDAGFYGLPGEVCDVCPENALCQGYRDLSTRADALLVTRVNEDGLNVTDCRSCHTQPRARAGYYNMKGKLNGDGVSENVCSLIRRAEGRRQVVECDQIVSCDPPEACLADNVCADGYADRGWPYRCGVCADGYYRTAGTCRRCPDSPELNIVFFFLVAVVAIGLAYMLNQKQINIAFLTIGLDYMQVISIFANTRVNWPPQIRELFRILSAFNLNIEVVAPECAFKGLTYIQKWSMIMLLPVAVNVLLLVFHAITAFNLVIIRGQSRKVLASQASPLLAMAQVMMYFLYLYITRSVFDIFTCRGRVPPEFDQSGQEIFYMAPIVERCGVRGGTQERLLPGAVAALIFYVLCYPAFIAYNLYTHRELVMEDQLLRAKRTGDDRVTNPHAHEFRRRWARTYYQFRPDMCMWVLAILLRKFLIAISSLVFNTNQNFQMAAMLLVLFLAYAAQVRFLPYMGPSTFDAILKDHEERARMGDATQLRLAATIAGIESRGRKRTATYGLGKKKIDVRAVAAGFAAFMFDYNTVEAILLASALLVSLAGVMFGAAEVQPNSAFYKESRDGVMVAVIILVALSIIYWLTVVVVEVYTVFQERSELVRAASAAGQNKRKKVGTGKKGSPSGDDEEDKPAEEFDPGAVETANNPIFLQSGKGGNGLELDASAVRSMVAVPNRDVWEVLRGTYVSTAQQVEYLEAEAAKLKAELEAINGPATKLGAAGKARKSVTSSSSRTPTTPNGSTLRVSAGNGSSGSDEEPTPPVPNAKRSPSIRT